MNRYFLYKNLIKILSPDLVVCSAVHFDVFEFPPGLTSSKNRYLKYAFFQSKKVINDKKIHDTQKVSFYLINL